MFDIILPMNYKCKKDKVPENETKAVMLSRLMTQENKNRLLMWVQLVCVAEKPLRKAHGLDSGMGGTFSCEMQEFSCSDILRRREEK